MGNHATHYNNCRFTTTLRRVVFPVKNYSFYFSKFLIFINYKKWFFILDKLNVSLLQLLRASIKNNSTKLVQLLWEQNDLFSSA